MVLTFYLRNQIIKCAGIPEVVEDSKNYLYAQFIFSPDWAGQTKTAIFGHDNNGNVRLCRRGEAERIHLGTLASFPRYTHVEQDGEVKAHLQLNAKVIDR